MLRRMSRLLLGATAIAAVICLALSYASTRDQARALPIAFSDRKASAPEIEAALRMARDARALQPDAGPKIVEASVLYRAGRREDTVALLREIVADEPANADAWSALASTAQDPRLASEARRQFEALRPR
jgi:predicted Zn-dependent protease